MCKAIEIITQRLGKENVLFDEPMKDHITFKVGGPAKYFVIPKNAEDLSFVIKTFKEHEMKYFVLGNGSNVIVLDDGFDGAIILVRDNFSYYRVGSDGNRSMVTVGAGMELKEVSKRLANDGLKGFEFATGIPGTMGGAMAMNAGAYGGEMKDIVFGAKVLDKDGNVKILDKEDLAMGYRTSAISKNGYVLLEAYFLMNDGDKKEIEELVLDYTKRREEKQPLDMPSAGSTFKRPEGHFAGKLIMDSGLRGYRHGGAMVSEKHCGFVVNAGDASASDILELIEEIQDVVYKKQGVKLEPEVRVIK